MTRQVYRTAKRDFAEEDAWRQWINKRHTFMTTPNEREYRYEERHDEYTLKCWHEGVETSWRGDMDTRPEWLERILVTAAVGGHLKRVSQPPPDSIVWFTTDLDNNLQSFLELT
jgi:hypothetical protein